MSVTDKYLQIIIIIIVYMELMNNNKYFKTYSKILSLFRPSLLLSFVIQPP